MRMERLTAKTDRNGPTVEDIAQERVIDRRKMSADLVTQRLGRRRFDQSKSAMVRQHRVARARRARCVPRNVPRMQTSQHPPAILGVRRDRDIDDARVRKALCVAQ